MCVPSLTLQRHRNEGCICWQEQEYHNKLPHFPREQRYRQPLDGVIKQCTPADRHNSLQQRRVSTQFWPHVAPTLLSGAGFRAGSPRSPDQSSNQSEKLELGSESARGRTWGHAGCQDQADQPVSGCKMWILTFVKPESKVPTEKCYLPNGIGPSRDRRSTFRCGDMFYD